MKELKINRKIGNQHKKSLELELPKIQENLLKQFLEEIQKHKAFLPQVNYHGVGKNEIEVKLVGYFLSEEEYSRVQEIFLVLESFTEQLDLAELRWGIGVICFLEELRSIVEVGFKPSYLDGRSI